MISRINESKRTVFICTVLIFLTMLVLNFMTLMVADDYIYSFSFANTSERMTSLTQIIPSMVCHYDYMNGRVILHSIVQIILMFPTIVFDILNAAMFCGLILFVYYYCCVRILKRHNAFLLLVITAFVVKFTPAFGHVYLWLDDAVNYLWPTVIALAYIYPLIAVFDGKKVLKNVWKQGIYVVIGIFIGALSESLSMAVMGILFLFLMIQKFYKKEKIRIWIPLSLLTCMIGYLFMMLSPGTWKSKVEGASCIIRI